MTPDECKALQPGQVVYETATLDPFARGREVLVREARIVKVTPKLVRAQRKWGASFESYGSQFKRALFEATHYTTRGEALDAGITLARRDAEEYRRRAAKADERARTFEAEREADRPHAVDVTP